MTTWNDSDGPAMAHVAAYAGIPSFMRQPVRRDLAGVDVAVVGVPYDGGANTLHAGTRLGPRAIRESSLLIAGFHLGYRFNPLQYLRVVDYGDLAVELTSIEKNIELVAEQASQIAGSGATLLTLGGDHSITYPLLMAHAQAHGPLAVIQFDAHTDTEEGHHNHGTPFVDAIRAGVLDASAYLQVGIRGGWYPQDPIAEAESLGAKVLTIDHCFEMGMPAIIHWIRQKVGDRAVYLSLDIDAVDPAYAPGTGAPEIGGFTSYQILQLVRGLKGLNIVGYDLVEVNPQLDPASITSLLGASLAYEFLCLEACAKHTA